jgi:hypothetical protein
MARIIVVSAVNSGVHLIPAHTTVISYFDNRSGHSDWALPSKDPSYMFGIFVRPDDLYSIACFHISIVLIVF